MATKNIVPRSGSEGQIGTTSKKWLAHNAVTGSFTRAVISGTGSFSSTVTTDSASFATIKATDEIQSTKNVLSPVHTFTSSLDDSISIDSGSTALSVTEALNVPSGSNVNIKDGGRLIVVPPTFFIQ